MSRKRSYNKSVYQSLTLVFQFGINMLVPIGMMLFLGMKLDEYFKTQWITVVLFFVGAIAGFTNIFKMAKGVLKNSENTKTEEDARLEEIIRLEEDARLKANANRFKSNGQAEADQQKSDGQAEADQQKK